MSVLVFADSSEGKFKKSAFEVVSYGKKVAEQLGQHCCCYNKRFRFSELYNYGAEKVVSVSNDQLETFNAKGYSFCITTSCQSRKCNCCSIDSSINGLYIAQCCC